MSSVRLRAQSATSSLRWLILASLGYVAPSACGGRAASGPDQPPTDEDDGSGGLTAGPAGGGNGPSAGTNGGAGRSNAATGGWNSTTGGAVEPPTPPGVHRACYQPTSLGGGFERCGDGVVRRPAAGTCPSELPRATLFNPAQLLEFDRIIADNGITPDQLRAWRPCLKDSDCDGFRHGYCWVAFEGGVWTGESALTQCKYGCTTDAECGGPRVCMCGSPIGLCTNATCLSDSDCPGDLSCTQYESGPGCGSQAPLAFACQAFEDACSVDADCPGAYCLYNGSRRECGQVGCPVPGRPFLVGKGPRVAKLAARGDWFSSEALSREPVHPLIASDPALRDELTLAWTEMALMEHASIASFARFALHLLSIGAPPELLAAATRAMQDETRHAQACFALARRYGGQDVGPGALDLRGTLSACDFESIVLAAVREGCIGETVAALEASEAAEHCADPSTRQVLEAIAREESEHAELAWRFVAWALRQARPALVEQVRCLFKAAHAGHLATAAATSLRDRTFLAFGVVTPAHRERLTQRAWRETVVPCADALLHSLGTLTTAVPECASSTLY